MKIRRPVGADLRADGRTDGRTEWPTDMRKVIVAFRYFSKAPKRT